MTGPGNATYPEPMFYWAQVTEIDGKRHEKILGRSNDEETAIDIGRHLNEKRDMEIVVIDSEDHRTVAEFAVCTG